MSRAPLVLDEDPLRLGGYWLAGRLGAGGQAVVYEAYDEAGARVAVKVLRSGGGVGPSARREVEAAGRVPSFCTARVLAVELEGERPYIVSEFVDGPSLHAAVKEHGPLSGDALHRLAIGTITAVAAIHQAGVVHRDLKPGNVLLGLDGPRVIDFGIARVLTESATRSLFQAGTLPYMAPEQFNSQRADKPADVHAWAAMLVFAATGRNAFSGETEGEVIGAVLHTVPDLGCLPSALRPLVTAAFAKNPADRPAAGWLLGDLIGTEVTKSVPAPRDAQEKAATADTLPVPESTTGATTEAGPVSVGFDALLEVGSAVAAGPLGTQEGRSTALGPVAEGVFDSLTGVQREMLAQVLLRMLEPEPGGGMALRSVDLSELPFSPGSPDVGVVVQRLVDAELVTRDGDRLSLGSAALARAWPRLRGWLDDEGEGLQVLGRLRAAVQLWLDHGRREGDLLQGSLLEQAIGWAATGRTRVSLNGLERSYLEASRRLSLSRQRRRRTVTAMLAGMVVVVLFAGLGLVALNRIADLERQRADEQSTLAEQRSAEILSRRLAQQSQAAGDVDGELAALLSAAAWETSPIDEARVALLSAVGNPRRGTLAGHTHTVQDIAFSPDGVTFASVSNDGIFVWDLATSERRYRLTDHDATVTSVAFSPDGTTIAAGGHDKDPTVRLWNVDTSQPVGVLAGHDSRVTTVAFSPDGATLASGSSDGSIRLWDVAAKQGRETLVGNAEKVNTVAFSPDGTMLASGGNTEVDFFESEGEVRLWDLTKPGNRSTRLDLDPFIVHEVEFSPDGTTLAITDTTDTWLWTVASGESRTLQSPNDLASPSIDSVAFSPDGTTLATGSSDELQIWDVATRAQLAAIPANRSLSSGLAFHPDSQTLANANDDGTVSIWDIASHPRSQLLIGHDDRARWLGFSADGATIVSVGIDGARLWNVADGTQTAHLEGASGVFAVSSDASLLAGTEEEAEEVLLWDTTTAEVAATLAGHPHTPTTLATALGGSADDTAGGGAGSAAFSPDGSILATAATPNLFREFDPGYPNVVFWDVESGDRIAALTGRDTWLPTSVAFTLDGTTLATSRSGSLDVRLWDVATREERSRSLSGAFQIPGKLSFSADGAILTAIGAQGQLERWHVADATLATTMNPGLSPLSAAASSPDGSMLAVADGSDGAIVLWDVATGVPTTVLPGQLDAFVDSDSSTSDVRMAFSPDGNVLAAAEDDGPVRLWDLSFVQDPYQAVCAQVGRSLTPQERERHLPDQEPWPVCGRDS